MANLLVLAAGVGSRYGGLKQMDPVGPSGEAVLDYGVFDAKRAGFDKVTFVIRKDIEADFRELLGKRFEKQIDVAYAFQERDALPAPFALPADRVKPWGTAHAVLCAKKQVNEPFAVINADDFYGRDTFRALAGFLKAAKPAGTYAMVGFQLRNTLSENGTVARGVCQTNAGGFLTSIEELTAIEKTDGGAKNKEADGSFRPLTGGETVSMNCWGFQPDLMGHLEEKFAKFLEKNIGNLKAECYLPAAVNDLINEKKATVQVLPTASSWFGVTYREDRPVVVESIRALVKAGEYPEKLWG
jgi:hypothetical protein